MRGGEEAEVIPRLCSIAGVEARSATFPYKAQRALKDAGGSLGGLGGIILFLLLLPGLGLGVDSKRVDAQELGLYLLKAARSHATCARRVR